MALLAAHFGNGIFIGLAMLAIVVGGTLAGCAAIDFFNSPNQRRARRNRRRERERQFWADRGVTLAPMIEHEFDASGNYVNTTLPIKRVMHARRTVCMPYDPLASRGPITINGNDASPRWQVVRDYPVRMVGCDIERS